MKRLLGGLFTALLVLALVFQVRATSSVQAAGFCGTPNASGGTGTCVSSGGGSLEGNFSPATVSISPVNFGEFDIAAEGAPAQLVTGAVTITVNDLTGANQGWTVNLMATNFDCPGCPTQISASNIFVSGTPLVSSLNSILDSCAARSLNSGDVCSGTSPAGSALAVENAGVAGSSTGELAGTAPSLASPGQIVAYACDFTGGGETDIVVPLNLVIPSEVLPGSYVNTFTAQLYRGPATNNTVCATLNLGRVTSSTPLDTATGAPVETATNLMLPM